MIIHEGLEFPLNIGIFKNVKVESFIGSGGFGEVWKIVETTTDTVYALKHMRIRETDPSKLTRAVGKIYTEVGSVGVIDSEYIVKTYGVKQIEDLTASTIEFVILYEFIDGVPFDEWLETTPSWEDRKKLFSKILQGIKSAHDRNIIHRDIKPQNILITKYNIPKIVDFGLAKVDFIDIETTVKLTATFPYAAPEYLTEKSITNKYDIYSLGCLLYTLVKGKNYCEICGFSMPPILKMVDGSGFKNDTILTFDPSFACKEDEKIPIIIKKSTNFNPDLRYNNIDKFINDWNFEKVEDPPSPLPPRTYIYVMGLIVLLFIASIVYHFLNKKETTIISKTNGTPTEIKDTWRIEDVKIENDPSEQYKSNALTQLEYLQVLLAQKNNPENVIEQVFNNNRDARVTIISNGKREVQTTVGEYFLNSSSSFHNAKKVVPISCKITTSETPSGSIIVYLNSIKLREFN